MEIKFSELLEFFNTKSGKSESMELPKGEIGFRIVVMDRGFVHCGRVQDNGDHYVIYNAKNIRVWGTKKGLGELLDGPTSETKLDPIGTLEVSKKAVLFMILCNREF